MAMDARVQLAIELTQIPTAAGREDRVVAYIEKWLAARPGLTRETDRDGNIVVKFAGAQASPTPLFITAHLDHPAFVVERVIAPGVVEVSFRGGVMDVFFEDAPVTLYAREGEGERATDKPLHATLTGKAGTQTPAGQHYLAEVGDVEAAAALRVGDVGTWRLPPAEVDAEGVLHTHACDDLAAAAAMMAAMDELLRKREAGEAIGDVRLLFTRAEEIGFVGAIGACKLGTMPTGSRVIALENSRAFPESPVGGGPIVRVGDRMSIFTPWLTAACAQRAEEIFGGASVPRASQSAGEAAKRPWQRKLMAGGACEASVYCQSGYDATCICLPLGNYHNMPHLTELQAGTYDKAKHGPARCAREFIHTQDYLGMVDLLVALGERVPEPRMGTERFEKLYQERKCVLGIGH